MWNEHDIWLRHYERMAQLRREASVARLCRQRRLARRKGSILATLLASALAQRKHAHNEPEPDTVGHWS
jgi:hypothetical protein